MRFNGNGLRILDFDIECRPLAFYGGDFVTKQPTAIAWKFIGERGPISLAMVGESFDTRLTKLEETDMLEQFCAAYDKADLVTGHWIVGFDLPLLTAALIRRGLPPLGNKLVQDTKAHFLKAHGMSKSQQNLGAMFELKHPKVPMDTALWEEGNMLTPKGLAATRKRVVGDVKQHVEMRSRMLALGLLSAPRVWTANGALVDEYQP